MSCTRGTSDLLACSFNAWYPAFEKVTVKSVCLPLPEEVASYVCSGGTIVSEESTQTDTVSDSEDDDSVDWDAAAEDAPELRRPEFAQFDVQLRAALEKVGGGRGAFVKLNWSAPVDVRWLSVGRALRSQTPDDVLVLLRSSERLQGDLRRCGAPGREASVGGGETAGSPGGEATGTPGVEATATPQLVLRRWVDISPAAEFRCFVRAGRLIAVSQREISQFFPHLARDAASIVSDIGSFFREHVQGRFPLREYVFDVYRPVKDRVRLLDFSPLRLPTEPGLFTWPQLGGEACLRCEERLSGEERGCEERLSGEERGCEERLSGEERGSGASCEEELARQNCDEDLPGHSGPCEPPPPSTAELPSPLCPDCAAATTLPVFQYIADADGIQRAPYADNDLPFDVRHLAEAGGTAAIIQLLRRSQLRDKSDGSSDDE